MEKQTKERLAKNEALFREINEKIRAINQDQGASDSGTWDFLCECADAECVEHVSLTLAEYEQARADPASFIVRPGHLRSGVETVTKRDGGYEIVTKLPGEEAVALETDPRG